MTDEPTPKKPRMISVKVLSCTQNSALVEWEEKGLLCRTYIPVEGLKGDKVEAESLETGIPYGEPWEEVKFKQPSAVQLATALRKSGLWTAQDLYSNPQKAIAVLQSVYGVDLAALVTFAGSSKKKE